MAIMFARSLPLAFVSLSPQRVLREFVSLPTRRGIFCWLQNSKRSKSLGFETGNVMSRYAEHKIKDVDSSVSLIVVMSGELKCPSLILES